MIKWAEPIPLLPDGKLTRNQWFCVNYFAKGLNIVTSIIILAQNALLLAVLYPIYADLDL